MSPQALLLTDRRPSGALTVLNPNAEAIDVRLTVRYGWVASDSASGRTLVRFLADSEAPAHSAARFVRFAPARFRLPPGGSQVVRFVAVAPAGIADGEYWGRVAVSAAAVDSASAFDSPVRLAGSVNVNVETVLPLFYRQGRVATTLATTIPPPHWQGDSLLVQPHFRRGEGGASIGMARVEALDRAGSVLASVSRQLAVYTTLDPLFILPVNASQRAAVAKVRVSVVSARPDLPEGLALPFLPVAAEVAAPPPGDPNPAIDADVPWRLAPVPGGPSPVEPEPSTPPGDSVRGAPVRRDSTRGSGTPGSRTDTVSRTSGSSLPLASSPSGADALAILAVVVGDLELGAIFTREGRSADRPAIPVRRFLELLGMPVELIGGVDGLRVRIPTARPARATLNPLTGRATRQAEHGVEAVRAFGPGIGVERDDEWYVDVEVLEWLTSLTLRIDVASASLLVEARRDRIPRFAAELARSDRQGVRTDVAPFAFGARETLQSNGLGPRGAVLTYDHSFDNQSGDYVSYATVGTTLLGGGLAMDLRAMRQGVFSRQSADVSWMGGSPLNRWLRQWRLGSGASTGPAFMSGRGVALSNSPFMRTRQLGSLTRTGTAPPGAEIELTRNGQVIGVTIADSTGHWSLPMQVDFGQNSVEIAIYTPQGVTRQSAMLNLESDLIPARTVEYGVTLQDNDGPESECRRGLLPCGVVSNADVRVGLSTRYTVRAGAYALRPRTGGALEPVPYAGLVGSPTDWLQVRGERARTGWWRARGVLQPSLRVRVEAGQEAVDPANAPFWLRTQSQFRSRETYGGLTLRPLPGDLGRAWLSTQWRQQLGTRGDVALLTATAGVRMGRALLQANYDRAETRDPLIGRTHITSPGASLTLPQVPRGPQWLRRTFVSVASSMDEQRLLRSVSTQFSASVARTMLLQGGVDWVRGTRQPLLRLQFQHHGGLATVLQDLVTGSSGQVHSATSVMGTASVTGTSGVSLSGDFVALRARVAGVAYEDRNGNGRFDPDEPRLSDVTIRVGGQTVRTDSRGRYQVLGLPVMDAVAVAAGTEAVLSLDGRELMPTRSRAWVLLVPYGESRVDVAFRDLPAGSPAGGVHP